MFQEFISKYVWDSLYMDEFALRCNIAVFNNFYGIPKKHP